MASKKTKGMKEMKSKNFASGTKKSNVKSVAEKIKVEANTKKLEKPEPKINEDIPVDKIDFHSGNPFNEITKGILHVVSEEEAKKTENCSSIVCIVSVPATTTCQDILAFTAPCHHHIKHFRILRDGNPNQYMTLVIFRSPASASEFYKSFNGRPYNSMEPEVLCKLLFVSKVEVSDQDRVLAELPSCPVCLEKMDENVDGVLTILCNHTFHSSCLAQWSDTSCPICRYAQTPEPIADSNCMECEGSNNDGLWICLICGHVGCSRYHEAHAFMHYQDTHHCYAMQLGTNRVWDYIGENFVHRLLQDKDGKLVETDLDSAKAEMTGDDEKIDSVMLEFTHSLTTQLQNQRQYFEDKLNYYEQNHASEIAELKTKFEEMEKENAQLQENLTQLEKEKLLMEKKLQSSNNKLRQILLELQEERELRKALGSNRSCWESKIEKLQKETDALKNQNEAEIYELKEQVRDLMFFVEAQKQIEQSQLKGEIEEGQIVVGESSQSSSGNSRRHRKGKR